MSKTFESISPELQDFIRAQRLFFVATAPSGDDGHVNLSPKGHDCFRVRSANRVAYLDLTGSGNETAAHLIENGRITFMFCAFDGAPKIVRLYGQGRVVLPDSPEWTEAFTGFASQPGIRQVIVAEISRVSTSCGYSLPRYQYVEERDTLFKWAERKGEKNLVDYRREKNAFSIDGLPAPQSTRRDER